jgi:hypothetical protein
VALRPIVPTLPFQLPNSWRPMDEARSLGTTGSLFFNADPNNQPVTVVNSVVNFGWEYVWHCHLLGHEENDMMRPMIITVPPAAPTNLVATGQVGSTRVILTWNDSSLNATHFTVQRATDTGFTANLTTFTVTKVPGTAPLYTDNSVVRDTTYYYRVLAVDTVGNVTPGYPSLTTSSAPSNVVTVGPPAAPSGLTASQPGSAGSPVNLEWTDNAPNAPNPPNLNDETHFTVQRATAAGGPWTTLSTMVSASPGTPPTLMTYSDTRTASHRTYWYRVLATSTFGSSAPSPSATITTQ